MTRPRPLSEEKIESLTLAPKGRRYEVPDVAVPHLFVRVGARSKKYVVLARFAGAKNPTRKTLGDFPKMPLEAARAKARKWKEDLDRGLDPRAQELLAKREIAIERRRTLRSVLEDYIVYIPTRPRNRHAAADIATLQHNVLCSAHRAILDKPIIKVTDEDLGNIVIAVRDRPAPAVARNVLSLLRGFYSWAMSPQRRRGYGLSTKNPLAAATPKHLEVTGKHRTAMLRGNELRAYWRAADDTPYPYGPFFKAVLLSGVRREEMVGARWSEIDWERRLWTVPEVRVKSTDAGVFIHLVPLGKRLLALFRSIRQAQEEKHGDCIFSTTNGQMPINGLSNATEIFRERMQIRLWEIDPDATVSSWVIHDDRRIVRSALSALEVPKPVAEAILAHRKKGIDAIYNQYTYLPQSRQALNRYAERLAAIVDGSVDDFVDDPLEED
ncbi:tyrosine-type recombinase/integrase [Rhizobium sp. LjRoot254]|uniref:tyrosine-type recombinase/integrase n=1 Tax=Rhizobium sp. LjRoot254 TaxID=3342297 RepID=UPI003F50C8E7